MRLGKDKLPFFGKSSSKEIQNQSFQSLPTLEELLNLAGNSLDHCSVYAEVEYGDNEPYVYGSASFSIEFPKSLISKLPKGERYALAGSISQNNIENIAKLGVTFCDLSSSLELDTQIGYKDHSKIKKFIKKVNELKN